MMKSVDLFCASPASTAICSSMVRQAGGMIRPPIDETRRLGDHHHRHKTKTKTPIIPCSISQIPISPKPYFDKYRKSTSSSPSTTTTTTTTPKLNLEFLRRKSSADISHLSGRPPRNGSSSSSRYLLSDTPLLLDLLPDDEPDHHDQQHYTSSKQPSKKKNSSNNNITISSKSRRHHDFNDDDYPVFRSSSLMSAYSYDNPVYESSSPSMLGPNVDLLHSQSQRSSSLSRLNHHHHAQISRVHDDFRAQKSSLSRTSSTSHATKSSLTTCKDIESYAFNKSGRSRDQVVELRVSIHCKGCEGKIRKHISRMEGVTSFSIDLATKKVTVIGNVTPLGVLTSISKVKNAELWPSPTSSSSTSSSSSTATTTTTSTTTTGMSIVSN